MKRPEIDQKRAVFAELKAAHLADGRALSLSPAEIAAALGTHALVAENHLRAVRARSAEERGNRAFSLVPVLASITAGFGDAADPVSLGSIPLDLDALSIKPSARVFALKVRGDSMIGAQIADGDLVVIEVRHPKVGDVVAALIDGETTLKRFVSEGGEFFLRAENSRYPDLIPMQELTIQGVMRAVVRVCDGRRLG